MFPQDIDYEFKQKNTGYSPLYLILSFIFLYFNIPIFSHRKLGPPGKLKGML